MADAIDPNAGTGDLPANEEANLVKQELAEVKAKLAEMESLKKQSQGQSATIRKLMETVEALAKKKDEPPAEDEKPKGPMAQKFAAMEAKIKEQEAREAARDAQLVRARMTALMRSVEGQIAAAGVKPGLAKMAAETLAARMKGQVTFDDSTGEDVAILRQGDDTVQISDFVAQYMASDEGKELLPEKDKPTLSGLMGKGSARPGSPKLRVTQADLLAGRFKMEDVIAGRVVLSDG